MKSRAHPSSSSASQPLPSAGAARPLDWPLATGQTEAVLQAIERHVRRRRRSQLAAATGAVALMIIVGSMFFFSGDAPGRISPGRTTAVVVEPERLLLPDGSGIDLRPGAAVLVNFTSDHRRVVLQSGEAHFEVAKDPARPFIVEASGVAVRAVGTVFSVQLGTRAVDILVTEGRVAVDQPLLATTTSLVDAGNRIVMEPGTTPSSGSGPLSVSSDEMLNRLAWRVPRLELNGAALSEVIELFNRHNSGGDGVRLALADPELGKLRLSGVLRADNVKVLLSILKTSYGLAAKTTAEGKTLIHRPE